MNRIVLIGNGFDLAHELPTSYTSFINNFWNDFIKMEITNYTDYSKDGITLKTTKGHPLSYYFKSDKQWNYSTIIERVKRVNENSKIDFHSSSIIFSIDNKFLKYISKQAGINNWLDIENTYYQFLLSILIDKTIDRECIYTDIKLLNSDFNYVKTKLEGYFTKCSQDNNTLEAIQSIYNIIFSSFYLQDFTEKAKEQIAKEEIRKIEIVANNVEDPELIGFSPKTQPFLNLYEHYDYKKLIHDLINPTISDERFDLRPSSYLFLNFNYTNTERLYNINSNENIDSIHVHGELGNIDNPIIFGYGDELEENYKLVENQLNDDFLENIKSVQYLHTDNYKRLLNFINSDFYQVIILGHSCGNSDRTLLNTLFEHENCVSIKPYYFLNNSTELPTDNYSSIIKNITRCFTSKATLRDKVVNKKFCIPFSIKYG